MDRNAFGIRLETMQVSVLDMINSRRSSTTLLVRADDRAAEGGKNPPSVEGGDATAHGTAIPVKGL
jgi:hypothetical protein